LIISRKEDAVKAVAVVADAVEEAEEDAGRGGRGGHGGRGGTADWSSPTEAQKGNQNCWTINGKLMWYHYNSKRWNAVKT
jgi:hypothetical protein